MGFFFFFFIFFFFLIPISFYFSFFFLFFSAYFSLSSLATVSFMPPVLAFGFWFFFPFFSLIIVMISYPSGNCPKVAVSLFDITSRSYPALLLFATWAKTALCDWMKLVKKYERQKK